jgi:predicted transcriptional regulator
MQETEKTIRDILPWGSIKRIAKEAGLSRDHVQNYFSDPKNWKGIPATEKKIVEATEKVLKEMKNEKAQSRQENLKKLKSIVKESQKN